MLKRVAIYFKENKPRTAEGVSRLIREFCKRGIRIYLHHNGFAFDSCGGKEPFERFTDLGGLKELPELVLSVGGDGTFLETMLKVRDFGIPIAGLNTGRIHRGEYQVVERSLLEIRKPADIFDPGDSTALNEVTIQKADASMITIHVHVDDTYLNTYWADGLIVSTATGSTAYNLSVGGPILSPEDESLIISPISPHNLTIRPIVISGESKLRMIVEGRSNEYVATCDFRSKKLPFTEEIIISRSAEKLKTVMLKGLDFYSTLRNRLMWGADRRN